jgi:hypothetical protein
MAISLRLAQRQYAEFQDLFIVMRNAIMLIGIILSVVAPFDEGYCFILSVMP